MQPSFTKFNARYRGPTYSDQIANIIYELYHDIKYLYNTDHKTKAQNDLIFVIDGAGTISQKPAIDIHPIKGMVNILQEIEQRAEMIEKEIIEWNL